MSVQTEVYMSEYSVRIGDKVVMSDMSMKNGGVYTVMIDKNGDDYVSNRI